VFTRRFTPAGFLSLLYLVPALCVLALLMVCFGGVIVCPSRVYWTLPLSPILRWLEWPWGEMLPLEMFVGPIWGKVFVLSSILANAAAIFATVKAGQWLAAGRFARQRACGRYALARLLVWKDQLSAALIPPLMQGYRRIVHMRRLNLPQRVGAGFALFYAIPALLLYIDALLCTGMLCDLGLTLRALPLSLVEPWRSARPFSLAVSLALNTIFFYLTFAAICRLTQILFRPRREPRS
jgi:hypothetical protein